MYMVIRLLIGGVLLLCAIFIIKKFNFINKPPKYIIVIILSAVSVVVLALIPLENCLYTFDSVENAFQYYTGAQKVKKVVSGQNSEMVIGEKNKNDIILILPRAENGWKIDTGANTVMKSQTIINDTVIYLYQHQNSGDYYIAIIETHGGDLDIHDSQGSVFQPLGCTDGIIDNALRVFYISILMPEDQYWLSINGNIIPFAELTS